MRFPFRRLSALALASALASPPAGLAQEPPGMPEEPVEPPAPATAPPGSSSLAGSWEGWAKLTNDWPGLACRYEGGPDTTSVRVELSDTEGRLKGSVAIDVPAEAGSGCPPLRKRYAVDETIPGPGTLSFVDSGGNEWTLGVRRNGTVLQGMLAWRQGGPDQPLAEGFTAPGGQRPAAHLSGEVRLHRGAEEAATEQPSGAATKEGAPEAPKKKIGAGGHAKNVAIILGANVVGLGLLYGVNKVGKGSSSSGTVTCSPRNCIVGATINDPCFCEGNVVSGSSCGTTTGGQPLNATCLVPTEPCQSGLSCNSGFCQDRDGRCPY
jgi:hypothetical protein